MIEELKNIVRSVSARQLPHHVRKNPALHNWVLENADPGISNLNEKIYSLVHGRPVCQYGNKRKFLTFSRGYGYCSRPESCKCYKDDVSDHSKEKWNQKDDEEIQKINERRSYTNLKKYGVRNVGQTEEAKESRRLFYEDRNKVQQMIAGIQETKRVRYGNENYVNSKKRKKTCLKKYGSEEFVQSSNYRKGRKELTIAGNPNKVAMYNKELLSELAKEKTPLQIAKDLGYANSSTVVQRLKEMGLEYKRGRIVSSVESDLLEYLKIIVDRDTVITTGSRRIIPNLELDVYVPLKELAIELNGVYWHTEISGRKTRDYHLSKTQRCLEKGITLLHIWDYEWVKKQDIVKSRIRNRLGLSNKKIYARKCIVKEIGRDKKKSFLNENHIQGNGASSINLGLFHNGELVSVMTFSKVRFSKKYEYELTRFCSELDTSVIGAAGKLFSYFVENYDPISVVSYADRRWGEGGFYEKIGFEFSHSSDPNYFYTKDFVHLESRNKFQKHKMPALLESYDPLLSEWGNMQANGYDRVWDCGNNVYVWRK